MYNMLFDLINILSYMYNRLFYMNKGKFRKFNDH